MPPLIYLVAWVGGGKRENTFGHPNRTASTASYSKRSMKTVSFLGMLSLSIIHDDMDFFMKFTLQLSTFNSIPRIALWPTLQN